SNLCGTSLTIDGYANAQAFACCQILSKSQTTLRCKVLNSGRGHGRGHIKDFAISAVTVVALRITVVAM
ncbi:hypothetical protein A2U01_0030766, partial [Trifolium medium]|nr:hypothetical protein [Trifolium medium]